MSIQKIVIHENIGLVDSDSAILAGVEQGDALHILEAHPVEDITKITPTDVKDLMNGTFYAGMSELPLVRLAGVYYANGENGRSNSVPGAMTRHIARAKISAGNGYDDDRTYVCVLGYGRDGDSQACDLVNGEKFLDVHNY